MKGGTTFTFVTDGIAAALDQARAAAGDRQVSIAGGAATVNQYLAAGLIDELRLHVAPVILGRGERLFAGAPDVDLDPVSIAGTELVTHLTTGYAADRRLKRSRSGEDHDRSVGDRRLRLSGADLSGRRAMRIGAVLVVVWLLIGLVAAAQRDYFSGSRPSCAKLGTVAVTIIAGPLNYVGVNPKVKCEVPQPSS